MTFCIIFFSLFSAIFCCAGELGSQPTLSLQSRFIWSPSGPAGKQVFVVFRKTFDLSDRPTEASLQLFADTRYMLWINGQYVARGPGRFNPKRPEFDTLDVTTRLRPGRNCIVVLVHHAFAMRCARIMDHDPGLTAQLDATLPQGKIKIETDATWKSNARTAWRPAPASYASICDNIDARLDPADWTLPVFNDAGWEPAVSIDGGKWGPLQPRALPLLRETEVQPLRLFEPADKQAAADSSIVLPVELTPGRRLLCDAGEAVQAYSVLEFEADADTKIELQHPILPQYGTAPSYYTARAGRQTWISGDTFGCRYLDLRVITGRLKLLSVKMIRRQYPYDRLGSFSCSNQSLNDIWDISINTVQGCSEDAYVDCMDRERAEWMADGYVVSYPGARVALATKNIDSTYAFNDQRLLRNMLRHVALSQLPDGRLQPMPPSFYPAEALHGVIDDYSCLWVQALRETYDRSSDRDFIRELWPTLVRSLDWFLARKSDRGLYRAMEFVYFNNPLIYRECEGATINAYLYRSLSDAAYLANVVGENANAARFESAAKDLLASYNRELWDEPAGTYRACSSAGLMDAGTVFEKWGKRANPKLQEATAPTAHAALMALYFGLVPADRQERTLSFLRKSIAGEKPLPYTYGLYLRTLFERCTIENDTNALDEIQQKWQVELSRPPKTVSEDFTGGSLVHEAGAAPAFLLSAYTLGVRTGGARDARQLIIEPHLGSLRFAKGVVLCEYGVVTVSWTRTDQSLEFEVTVPPDRHATLCIPRLFANATMTLDSQQRVQSGRPTDEAVKATPSYFLTDVGPGSHHGILKQ